MVLKDKRTTSTDLQKKYSTIENKTNTVLWLKTEIKKLSSKKDKTAEEANNLARMQQTLKNQENQLEEKKENLSRRQKNKIIREQYRALFQSDLSKSDQFKDSIQMVFNPALLLKNQFETLESLKESITLEGNNNITQEEIADFFELLKKVNQFLIVLRNLEVNVPEPTKSPLLRAQRGMIKTPVYGAEFFAKLFTRGKREINERFRNINNSLEEYIAFQAFESCRDTLLSVPSFFPKRDDTKDSNPKNTSVNQEKQSTNLNEHAQKFLDQLKEFETRVTSTEASQLHILYAQILNTPSEMISDLRLDLNKPINHPKKIYYDLKHKLRQDLPQNSFFINVLEEAINKHEIVASLLNMEFSYWRRFALLNLETVKSTMNRMNPKDLLAITFNETQMIPSLIDVSKIAPDELSDKVKDEILVKRINETVESSIADTFAYEVHQWQIGDNTLGQLLKDQGVSTAFTSYNRSLINSRSKEVNATIPRSAYALLKTPQDSSKKFEVELKNYGTHSDERYDQYHSRMLECWIESTGDIQKTKQAWKQQLAQYSPIVRKELPSFDELLSRVYTLPCVLLVSEVSNATNLNQLQQELTQKTNELRSDFVTASMLIAYGVNKKGDFALSISCDHSNWDGMQSGEMAEKALTKIIAKTIDIQLDPQEIQEANYDHVDVDTITATVTNSAQPEKEGNHQIQSYVEAEGFVRICDEIGKIVNKLIAEHKISPDSKLKNPAVIMQLILVNEYREILAAKGGEIFSPNQSIGMLLGNPDITKDLDLAPIQNGFNFELFRKLSKEQQNEYLISQALLFEIALANTSMDLIKQVAESIPNKRIQNTLNAISRTWPLRKGLQDLANKFMISNFGLPRIINGEIKIATNSKFQVIRSSGPAQANFQTGSMTIVGAVKLVGKFYLSICYKNENNDTAVEIAQDFKQFIEQYDQKYYEKWMAEQNVKGG